MFVAVALDAGSEERFEEVGGVLEQYGFKKVQAGLWESPSIMEKYLSRLKRDIDRKTDFYDKLRIYQYPLEGTLIITSLKRKRWKRTKLKI
ncbi:MAG TPA: CRISPR-associated protein Cas2 [Sediminispirochaeta sp.]|nr:CRISPR-associated protein Cas2 [Sediminispirochaeta sp.]